MVPVPGTNDVVPKFKFLDQVLDLLSGEYFHNEDSVKNCCVNKEPEKRFSLYEAPPDEGMSEMTSGSWYHETYISEIPPGNPPHIDIPTNTPYHNWLLPLIIYNDKTGVSAMEGSYTLEPFMFTLGIIRRAIREKSNAWRHFGFIPSFLEYDEDMEKKNSETAKRKITKSAEEALSFTHQCLSILLSDLKDLQKTLP